MTPANLKTILICQFDPETIDIAKDFIQYTMKDHFFSEIHFNLENPKWPQQKEKYSEVLSTLLQNFGSFKGYFYLYMPFVSKFPKCQQILEILKQNPLFQVICVSKPLGEVFNEYIPTYIGAFPVYQDGISFNQIRVSLSNVSIYDEQNDSAVSDFSGVGYGFIKNEDFLNLEKKICTNHI